MVIVEDETKFEKIVADLGRKQGLAKSAGETFVAFLIASAQREAGARYAELIAAAEDALGQTGDARPGGG